MVGEVESRHDQCRHFVPKPASDQSSSHQGCTPTPSCQGSGKVPMKMMVDGLPQPIAPIQHGGDERPLCESSMAGRFVKRLDDLGERRHSANEGLLRIIMEVPAKRETDITPLRRPPVPRQPSDRRPLRGVRRVHPYGAKPMLVHLDQQRDEGRGVGDAKEGGDVRAVRGDLGRAATPGAGGTGMSAQVDAR